MLFNKLHKLQQTPGSQCKLYSPVHMSLKRYTNSTKLTPASLASELELVVDIGSAVSILPQHIYDKYFSTSPLLPHIRQLVTYTRKKIAVLGCLQIKVSRGLSTASATFFAVKKGSPLLGRDLMAALNICIKGNAVLPPLTASFAPVMTTNSAPASCIPAAPDSGSVHDCLHKVKTDYHLLSNLYTRNYDGCLLL